MAFMLNKNKIENFINDHLRLFMMIAVGTLVFVGLTALSVFFIFVNGRDQVMVPDITGKELVPALLELQKKELYPRIQLRTSDAADRGLILEQSPDAGTIVKAERRINLIISEGLALDKVGDYIGRNISDIRTEIAVMPFINLKEPFMYQYAAEPAGTIIQQNPQPGKDLTGPVSLELVVSRGRQNAKITVPNLEGLGLQAALERLGQAGALFTFELRTPEGGEKPETVADQKPVAGSEIDPESIITLTLYSPLASEGETSGLFRYNLPKNPYPLPVTVDALIPGGTRRRLASVNHPGGSFSVPYKLPAGSTIILSMLDRELTRRTVQTQNIGQD